MIRRLRWWLVGFLAPAPVRLGEIARQCFRESGEDWEATGILLYTMGHRDGSRGD